MDEWPPRPDWRPDTPVDIERIVETFSYYVDRRKAFLVFEHGTCAVPDAGAAAFERTATQMLHDVINAHVDFNPQRMDDGNWTVSFNEPVYSVLFEDEIARNWAYIEQNHLKGLPPDEVLFGAEGANVFDRAGKIGLFGRARLFMDALAPVVAVVWRPEPGAA